MTQLQPGTNPFMLMTDPQAVFAALACSDRLSRLESRQCRPLDNLRMSSAKDEELEPDAIEHAQIELSGLPSQGSQGERAQ